MGIERDDTSWWRAVVVHGCVWLAFVAAAVLFTWPLAAHLGGALPGDHGDPPLFLWDEWWFSYAARHGKPIFSTDLQFAPSGAPLAFHTYTPLNGLLAMPLASLFGTVRAHNLLVLWSWATAGWATFALAGRYTKRLPSRLFAGFVFAFCPYRFAHLLGHINLTSTQWIPLFALAIVLLIETRSKERGALAGVAAGAFFAANVYTELTYALFSGVIALVLVTHAIVRNGKSLAALAIGAASAAVTAGILVLPFVLGTFSTTKADLASPPITGAELFSADALAYVLPSQLHPLTPDLLRGVVHGAYTDVEHTVFPGWSTWLLALLGFARIRARKDPLVPWALLALIGIALSLGPFLRVGGQKIPMPWMAYDVVDWVPIVRNARAPSRFACIAILGLAVASAIGLELVLDRLKARWARILSVAPLVVVALEFFPAPFPMHELPPCQAEATLARAKDGVLLSLPLGGRSAYDAWGIFDSDALYLQTVHQKPIFGGMVARIAPERMKEAAEAPLVRELVALQEDRVPEAPLAAEDARAFVQRERVRWVAIHPPFMGAAAERFLLDRLHLVEIAADPSTVVYRIADGAPAAPRVDFGEGWFFDEADAAGNHWRWMGLRSRMHVEAVDPAAEGALWCVRLVGHFFGEGGELAVSVDDAPSHRFVPQPLRTQHVFVAPRRSASGADVVLVANRTIVAPPPDARVLSYGISSVSIRAIAQGDASCAPSP